MYHSRPIFNVIDSSNIHGRRELKLFLRHVEIAYRSFAQRDLIRAQRSLINSIINIDVPIDPAIDEVVNRFCEVACLQGPAGIPLTIILNDSLMYVYCSFREMRRYAHKRLYDGVSDGSVVISTVPPYTEGIRKETMRSWQNNVGENTSDEIHNVDAYIAFLPTTSLQNPSVSHMKIRCNSFLAPSRVDPFCVEIIAVGKALFEDNGLKKKPKLWGEMALTSLWKRLV
ncbi:RolB family protein [Agrobacterium vitis]|uniref:5 n=1 Tax=Agrobacterium vitis TaxID=373 RepID=P94204_AGRVI|nr:RolB family protein [Agrobacterium vitis]AAB41867.1 5 (plasmid) [Agrobacterium vitis]